MADSAWNRGVQFTAETPRRGENAAGKQLSSRTKKGNKYLRRILTQSAWAASRLQTGIPASVLPPCQSQTPLGRAVMAVAHKIVVIAYCILKTGAPYQDLGDDYFDRVASLFAGRTTNGLGDGWHARRLSRDIRGCPPTSSEAA